ncbi:MAG: hypothetical protein IPP97_08705 [Candidatus Obscuribacter sp.]|nr:hypothetical protein [Candidatus Obscuribacter sp.]
MIVTGASLAMSNNPSPLRKAALELAGLSFLSLFLELMIIRWLSSEVRTFAYFKNVPLMACLFGLGLGLALSQSKRDWQKWFPWSLLAIITLICFAGALQIIHITIVDPHRVLYRWSNCLEVNGRLQAG